MRNRDDLRRLAGNLNRALYAVNSGSGDIEYAASAVASCQTLDARSIALKIAPALREALCSPGSTQAWLLASALADLVDLEALGQAARAARGSLAADGGIVPCKLNERAPAAL